MTNEEYSMFDNIDVGIKQDSVYKWLGTAYMFMSMVSLTGMVVKYKTKKYQKTLGLLLGIIHVSNYVGLGLLYLDYAGDHAKIYT